MTTLEKFYELVDDIEIAMMTTRRLDGHLRSRPMATQKQAPGADLWFVTRDGTPKLQDLTYDRHLNLGYFRPGKSEWISASGRAEISRDRIRRASSRAVAKFNSLSGVVVTRWLLCLGSSQVLIRQALYPAGDEDERKDDVAHDGTPGGDEPEDQQNRTSKR